METPETTANPQKKGNSVELMLFGWLCYIGAVVSIGYGLIMMYKNFGPDLSSLNVNAYVGGDGYNYIINGTYATTFCALAAALAIIGSTCFIVNAINKK